MKVCDSIAHQGAPAKTSKDVGEQPLDTLASQLSVWEDSEDTFCFWPLRGARDAVRAAQSGLQSDEGQDSATDNKDAQGKKGSHRHIVLCPDGELPPSDLTPNFDLDAFYEALEAARGRSGGGVSDGRLFRHDPRLLDWLCPPQPRPHGPWATRSSTARR